MKSPIDGGDSRSNSEDAKRPASSSIPRCGDAADGTEPAAHARFNSGENSLRRLADNSGDILFRYELSPEHRFAFISAAVTDLSGYSPENFYADPELCDKLIYPDDRSLMRSLVSDRGGPGHGSVLRWFRKDGSILSVEQKNYLVRDGAGRIVAIEGIARDITRRRLIEEELTSRDRLLLLSVNISHGLFRDLPLDTLVSDALESVGSTVGVDRIYVFMFHEANADPGSSALADRESDTIVVSRLRMSQRYEWCAPSVDAQIDNPALRNIPIEGKVERWYRLFSEGRPVHGAVAEFPEIEREDLEPQGIVSLLAVPVFIGSRLWGFVGFDDCHAVHLWTDAEIGILSSLAASLGMTIVKHQQRQELLDTLECLAASESKYRLIAENSADVIWTMNREGLVTYISPSIERLSGYSSAEVMSYLSLAVLPDVSQHAVRQLLLAQLDRLRASDPVQVPLVIMSELKRRDGSLVDIENSVQSVFQNGRFEGCVGVTRDVSERNKAELALSRSRQRTKAILDANPDIMFVFSADGVILEFKADRLEDLYTAPELFLGRSVHETLPPDLARLTCDSIERVKRTGTMYRYTYEIELAGAKRSFESRMVGCGEDEYVAILRDVTEQVAAEKYMRDLASSLERRVKDRTREWESANRELEAFAYSVSHDLKSPLKTLEGYIEMLESSCTGKLDGRDLHILDRIRASSQRMGQLVDATLDLSRITRMDFVRRRVDLSALARTVATELSELYPEPPVEYEIEPGLSASGDVRLLRIAFTNLLDNARKYSSKSPSPHVIFRGLSRIGEGGDRAEIETVFSVEDNGVGFDMEQVGVLFKPFQRLHSHLEYPGIGIGLASVYRIVARHGGRIWAEGSPGSGAIFRFTLGA